MSEPIAALTGPTASGKTGLAIALAGRYPIEIVSADSMQVYRGLDAGTAKPTAEERRSAPHHAIDVAEPGEHYNLARYLADAAAAVADIRRRGKIPLIVGGTGLYLKALRDGIFATTSRDAEIRAALEARIEREGAPALHAELTQRDPETASRVTPRDAIRIVRALEALEVTGKTMAQLRADDAGPQTARFEMRLAVLAPPRDWLRERIERRSRAMLEAGWAEEVERLLEAGLAPDAHCFKALGYRRVARFVRGEEGREGLESDVALETTQFAKRQITWFRAMRGSVWLNNASLPHEAALRALELTFRF